jgi:hypothetical protein
VGRDDKVPDFPEIEPLPRMIEHRASGLHPELERGSGVDLPNRRPKETPVVDAASLIVIRQDTPEPVEQAEVGLEGIDLPVDDLPHPLR